MEQDDEDPSPQSFPRTFPARRRSATVAIRRLVLLGFLLLAARLETVSADDSLDRARASGRLVYGSDQEGGAPFIYFDEKRPDALIGFEVELLDAIGKSLKLKPTFKQAQWDTLLQVLARGEVDVVVNGYELTDARTREYLATRPYFVYQLQLMSKRNGQVRSLADFQYPRPGGGPWQVGVLGGSVADTFMRRAETPYLRVVSFDGATNAMMAVRNGQIDATLQDLPAARYWVKQAEFSADLGLAGPPEGCGYYVMYLRREDVALRDALDDAIRSAADSGDLKRIYEKYDVWNEAQDVVLNWRNEVSNQAPPRKRLFDGGLLANFFPFLLKGAGTTIILSFSSMPLAMLIGLITALGRMYGPRPARLLLGCYVELVRGTPLLLQLFVLFYLLPELGITLSPWVAGVAGLAINYSAYEAEIYRAGLQAIPKGQMEAALALGMTRGMALRRVIIPQAARIVIPPVTSDFIALFKDTSVCSVITLTELTKSYSILFNGTGGVVEFGLATAGLYMAMSLPLSWFSRWVERRLDAEASGAKGGISA